jgi:hypothetical protein
MTARMAEIRFPLRGRHPRRSPDPEPPTEPEPEAAVDPLAEMAAQVRELDAAAVRVASRISDAAASLREGQIADGSATRADLLAGLGAALVDRTQEIRSDCERLSALMERTARLIAERDKGAPAAPPQPEPEASAAEEHAPKLATELGALLPDPVERVAQADPEPEIEPAPLPRLEPEPAVAQPAELPAGTSEGVRLIATQMAIAGSSRAEIERRLRIQFGVRDADQALDEIFGTRRSGVS